MKINFLYFILIGAGLTACSSFSPNNWTSQTTTVDNEFKNSDQLEAQIKPYRDSLSVEMNEIIGFSPFNLVKDRPCSDLNNWAADALLKDQDSLAHILTPNLVLLNVGGLRSSINKGNITRGDIFSFMPFDNEVVWVKMPISALKDIAYYISKSGGEPIANAEWFHADSLVLTSTSNLPYFWIVTSDYLMNGGDNMSFFNQKLEVVATNKLLRDAFMDQVRREGTLVIDKKCRIHVEK